MSHLTPAQNERLGKLVEELGESGQAAGKILVHGYDSSFEGITYSNRSDLERELGDVKAIIDLLETAGDLSAEEIEKHRHAKRQKVGRYLKYQPPEVMKLLQDMAFGS